MNSASDLPHVPVLLDEVLRLLDPKPGEHCVDVTVGSAGHSRAILERTGPNGRLLGLDLDPLALRIAEQTLAPYASRTVLKHAASDSLLDTIRDTDFPAPSIILADLGLSSMELGDASRGFSFQHPDAPLDLRFDPTSGRTAADLLKTLHVDELERILRDFGEEPNARRIAKCIVEKRRTEPFTIVSDLVRSVLDAHGRRSRIHPATRTFQAFRIAVNDELGRLERFLPQALDALALGGRIAVIAFHSLEDRIVKRFLRVEAATGRLALLTKHPATPGFAEVTTNPRSRSAKLRVAVLESAQRTSPNQPVSSNA